MFIKENKKCVFTAKLHDNGCGEGFKRAKYKSYENKIVAKLSKRTK